MFVCMLIIDIYCEEFSTEDVFRNRRIKQQINSLECDLFCHQAVTGQHHTWLRELNQDNERLRPGIRGYYLVAFHEVKARKRFSEYQRQW